MKKLIIIGSSGQCIDILDTINEINIKKNTYQCLGFLDDDKNKIGNTIHGLKILGPLNTAQDYKNVNFVFGIGSPDNFKKRKNILEENKIPVNSLESLIHPTAFVSDFSNIGKGVIVFQNTTIASNVKIGNCVTILPNSIISHDSIIDDYTIIAGGVCISGNVKIGKKCYIGSNSSIKNNVSIGNNCLVGIGTNVINTFDKDNVIIGNPGRSYDSYTHK